MRRIPHLLIALLAGVALGSCGEPDVDDFRSDDGSAPDPTGVIEGTVFYVGPRPQCEFRGEVAVRAKGRIILTLFDYDNPPPPSGGASSAENLLTIPGSELFPDLSDCLPEGEEPDRFDPDSYIMRSVAFVWPEIHLDRRDPIAYQIRGFYDYDEDFNPFFSVSNLPTFGDVVGGALERVPDPGEPSRFLRIEFPSQADAPNGVVNDAPTVTLGAVVNTERPVFSVEAESALDSEQPIPLVADASMREQMLYNLTGTELVMYARDPAARGDIEAALDAAGLAFDFDNEQAYAWYVTDVDADGDGSVDPHPILGAGGVSWHTPIIIMQRAQTAAEVAAGVPGVLIIGSVRPTQLLTGKSTFYRKIDFVVPPIAAVDLVAGNPQCRVPYIPAGNALSTYERVPVMCHEVPTGPYNVSVLQGVAGGQYAEPPLSSQSDTGWIIQGGQLSGQAWSIPNALSDPEQLCADPTDCPVTLPEQGLAGRFVVHDPNPDSPIGLGDDEVPAGCQMAIDTDADPPAPASIDFLPVPSECCAPIDHLCDLPLCDVTQLSAQQGVDAEGRNVRQGVDADGDGQLDCMPFLLPPACCGG